MSPRAWTRLAAGDAAASSHSTTTTFNNTTTTTTTTTTSATDLVYNLTSSGASYTMQVTDGVDVYEETLCQAEVEERQAELNPAVEVSAEDLVEEIGCLMVAKTTHVRPERLDEDRLAVTLQGKLIGYDFRWSFHLVKSASARMHSCVLKDLAAGLAHLLRQQEHLLAVIRAKDLELEEYAESGATLTRRALKTEPFKKEDLQKVSSSSSTTVTSVLSSEEYAVLMNNMSVAEKNAPAEKSGGGEDSGIVKARRQRIRIKGAAYQEEEEEEEEDKVVQKPKAKTSPVKRVGAAANGSKASRDLAKKLRKL